MKVVNEFDFGFEIVAGDDINKDVVAASQEETTRQAEETHKLRQMILPLLHNLAKNPDKEYIKWPNRTATINRFIEQMFDVSGLVPGEDDLV